MFLVSASAFATKGKVEVAQINSFSMIYITGDAAKEISKNLEKAGISNGEVSNYQKGKSLSCQDTDDGGKVCTIALKENGKDGELSSFVF